MLTLSPSATRRPAKRPTCASARRLHQKDRHYDKNHDTAISFTGQPADLLASFTLQAYDTIAGSISPAHSKVFLIGAFDSRITFYTQQVRALELVHALREQGHLTNGMRVGVVGGGAAGATAAAAIALVADVSVDLYERADELIPLQRATQRRRLDPHIYEWPEIGSDDPIAALPVLDWASGPSRDVRNDVRTEFNEIQQAVTPRLRTHFRHEIVASRAAGTALQLDFYRDLRPGEKPDAPDNRKSGHVTVDLLVLAFGFGIEPTQAIPGVQSASYWDEAGIPVAEFSGRPTPRFLISGNGDGGLIDLVAAASADFDHAGMIREIVTQPNIDQITDRLEEIDRQAHAAFRSKAGFDFLTAYDTELRDSLQGLGLFDLVSHRLRPGVHLTLQTLKPEMFSIETATLNRLAAYLVVRACESGAQTAFNHIHGPSLAPIPQPDPAAYQAPLWFTCAGQTFGVDRAIIRRGPDREAARSPFKDLIAGYKLSHDDWRQLHGAAAIVPKLSLGAYQGFLALSRSHHLPNAGHVQRSLQQHQPAIVRAQAGGAQIRWSGDLPPEGVAEAWDSTSNGIEVLVPSSPAALGALAPALVRLSLHANKATLVGDPVSWRTFADPLTIASAHSQHLACPAIRSGPVGGTQNPRSEAPDVIASALQLAMNRWMLAAVDTTVRTYFATGRDPGTVIGFVAADDLRSRMGEIWAVWNAQFIADNALLDRFLRLTICAEDDDARLEEARVLVGPRKLPHITRAIAAALSVAAAWPETTPRTQRPGNLVRARVAGTPLHGHACAAELISREPTAIAATSHVWRTHFVVLSQLDTPLSVVTLAQTGFADVDQIQPALSQPGEGGIFLTLDAAFRAAAESGLATLTALLGEVEIKHFARLNAAVTQV